MIKARVKPHAAAKFRAVAKEQGLTESQAVRQAVARYVEDYERKAGR